MVDAASSELYWLSGHISSITEDEKHDVSVPKIQLTPSTTPEDVSYKFIN
jgi:hypothetical protein